MQRLNSALDSCRNFAAGKESDFDAFVAMQRQSPCLCRSCVPASNTAQTGKFVYLQSSSRIAAPAHCVQTHRAGIRRLHERSATVGYKSLPVCAVAGAIIGFFG